MREFYIQFGIGWLIVAALALCSILLFAWAIGYSAGVQKSERQFMDKFVRED